MTRLFGGLLLAVGILIMTSSGLCSLYVTVVGFTAALRDPTLFLFPVVVGGLPFALGLSIYRWGRSLLRQADADGG